MFIPRCDAGFSGLYPILKAMEKADRIRRGSFVAGLGAAQFTVPGAEDRLRGMDKLPRDENHDSEHDGATRNLGVPSSPRR